MKWYRQISSLVHYVLNGNRDLLKLHLAAQLNVLISLDFTKKKSHKTLVQSPNYSRFNCRLCKVLHSYMIKLLKTTQWWVFSWVAASNKAYWEPRHAGNQGNKTIDKHFSVIRPAHWRIPNEDVIYYTSLHGKQCCWQQFSLVQKRGNVSLKVGETSLWLENCQLTHSEQGK